VQRPADAAGRPLGVPLLRLGPRLLGQHGHEGAQASVERLDAPERFLHERGAGRHLDGAALVGSV
jgi:hypothetical protein